MLDETRTKPSTKNAIIEKMKTIRRVGVLGAGTMGARIAAHFSNIGIPSLLLDLDPATARKGLDAALKQKPVGLFDDSSVSLISTGGFDQDLASLGTCDWIIEAVKEDLASVDDDHPITERFNIGHIVAG